MTASKKVTRNFIIIFIIAAVVIGLSMIHADAASISAKSATGYVNAKGGVNIRKSASTSSKVVKVAKDNAKLTIEYEVFKSNSSTSKSKKWYRVKTSDGKKGYVRSDYVDGIKYSTVKGVTTDTVNYRAGAGTSMSKKGTLSKGSAVTVYMKAKPNNSSTYWYKIKVGSSYRYVSSKYIAKAAEAKPAESQTKPDDTAAGTNSGQSSGTETKPEQNTEQNTGNNNQGQNSSTENNSEDNSGQSSSTRVPVTANTATGSVNASDGLNVRKSASLTSDKVTTLNDNAKITIEYEVYTSKTSTAAKDKWYKIKTSAGKSGYVRSDYVDGIKYTAVTGSTTEDVNYRVGPGTSMTKKGTLNKGTAVTIYLKARPSGSSEDWFRVKVGSSYVYLSAAYITATSASQTTTQPDTTSETETKPAENTSSSSSSGSQSAGTNGAALSDAQFEKEMTAQGFPESYKVLLRALHKAHPKWRFVSTKVGANFSTAVDKQYKDGVSLINSVYVRQYGDLRDCSYTKGSSVNVYQTASSSSKKLGTLADNTEFTVLGAKVSGGVIYWKVKTGSITGFIKGTNNINSSTNTPRQMKFATTKEGVVTSDVNVRSMPDTDGVILREAYKKNTKLTVVLPAEDDEGNGWYIVRYGDSYACVSAKWVKIDGSILSTKVTNPKNDAFISARANLGLSGKGRLLNGTYKAKDGSSWFNANRATIEYYMDPRNFLNEDRVYMFEDLSFSSYQNTSIVDKVLDGTQIPVEGYKSIWFYNYGKQYNVSPVHLASRARQEVGGGSKALSGYTISGVKYYNPFNIGATSGADPLKKGMEYAKSKGWNTKEKAIKGGAAFIADGYINNKQNTIYTQKFNVANGSSSIATHQYMTNIMAPYSESLSVRNAYNKYGITNESLVFAIPVYNNMPSSTSLPK